VDSPSRSSHRTSSATGTITLRPRRTTRSSGAIDSVKYVKPTPRAAAASAGDRASRPGIANVSPRPCRSCALSVRRAATPFASLPATRTQSTSAPYGPPGLSCADTDHQSRIEGDIAEARLRMSLHVSCRLTPGPGGPSGRVMTNGDEAQSTRIGALSASRLTSKQRPFPCGCSHAVPSVPARPKHPIGDCAAGGGRGLAMRVARQADSGDVHWPAVGPRSRARDEPEESRADEVASGVGPTGGTGVADTAEPGLWASGMSNSPN
jgi:hypothetical protein